MNKVQAGKSKNSTTPWDQKGEKEGKSWSFLIFRSFKIVSSDLWKLCLSFSIKKDLLISITLSRNEAITFTFTVSFVTRRWVSSKERMNLGWSKLINSIIMSQKSVRRTRNSKFTSLSARTSKIRTYALLLQKLFILAKEDFTIWLKNKPRKWS